MMARKLKVFASFLAAMTVTGAMGAPSALATYDTEFAPIQILGEHSGAFEFVTTVGTLKCTNVRFSTTANGEPKGTKIYTDTVLRFRPIFTAPNVCTLAGLKMMATVAEKCSIEFGNRLPGGEAPLVIACGPGEQIVFKDTVGAGCELSVEGIQEVGKVAFENSGTGTGRKWTGKMKMEKVEYDWTAGCPNSGKEPGTAKNGAYAGKAIFEGTILGTPFGIWTT
jgi:hypothetical protein